MKQNLSTVKAQAYPIVLLFAALLVFHSACARLPGKSSSDAFASVEAPTAGTALRININTAPAKELEKLPGVGKVIAERIIAHREQYGPFRRVEHLMLVRGISDRKFRAFRSMIVAD